MEIDTHCEKVGAGRSDLIEELLTADLVILATGDWAAEGALNSAWLKSPGCSDLIVTWMEAHAFSAHSVHLRRDPFQGCLQCGLSGVGKPKLEVIKWSNDQMLQVPACGGLFMPYGPVGLAMATTLVAEHCVDVLCAGDDRMNHRSWLGEKGSIKSAGGQWSNTWVEEMGDPGNGSERTSRVWRRDMECPACKSHA